MSELIRNSQIYVISTRLGKLLFSGSKGKKYFKKEEHCFYLTIFRHFFSLKEDFVSNCM